MARIFLVEDDPKIREELTTLLEKYGHICCSSDDFTNMLDAILKSGAELLLLDINLPVFDGYHICRELRKVSDLPIIIVTSRDSDVDELMSMNLGADDFITKPYNTQILLARINSVLNRAYNNRSAKVVSHNGVSLDLATSIVSNRERQAELTKNELRILHLLMTNSGSILSRDELMNDLWQSDEFVDDNTLTVNINRLRKKLEEIGITGYLITKRGRGYMV
ncbi:response regulator receiver domain protein [[Clostridium] methylpentosum DSM 5476]|uniref:Stage 0 sporulation protein A homolog n=1 Tax=[Clostridium] methylpentosum DSM 5476 TaxID=537013 RepID=C0ECJ8_9FIRM|nr:response regulator receiver domain protein [[Clostridium] methylpentosum DSM 5476]MEE1490944.1 response regulator transcription factor [Massilioclostridium sp.]